MSRILEIVEREKLNTKFELEYLLIEVSHFVRTTAVSNDQPIYRENGELDPELALQFFRSKERIDNLKLLLQYLISFLKRLPLANDLDNELINPFDQFREFVRYEVDLLKEDDVRQAILGEFRQRGLLTEGSDWFYKLEIQEKHEELSRLIEQAQETDMYSYGRLFEALLQLSIFWFEVKDDIQHIRQGDIFIYKLCKFLLAKLA